MKRQYLGDARDAFKWEYQDILCRELAYSQLLIIPMLTPDDGTNEGSLHSSRFPAASAIHEFCATLRVSRSLADLKKLPSMTGANYQVALHKPSVTFLDLAREKYFADIHCKADQLIFVDPDIGFEPKGRLDKHLAFSDLEKVLDQATEKSAVTIYQHKRRSESFRTTLGGICRRLSHLHYDAIHNHSVMFVTFSRSRSVIEKVAATNALYGEKRMLHQLGGKPKGDTSIEDGVADVLAALNRHKTRATYGAVAAHLGTQARRVGRLLGMRRPEASWVVSKRSGIPTGYREPERHKDLLSNSRIIESGSELTRLVKRRL